MPTSPHLHANEEAVQGMVVLKRVGVMSVAKILAVLSAIVGLIEGIMFAGLGSMLGMLGGMLSGTPVAMLGVFGFSAIIIFPVAGAISGFIGGAIGAFLYNLVAARIGGIEMDLVRVQAAVTTAPPVQPATIPTAAPIPTQPTTIPAPAPVLTAPPVADAAPARFCPRCGAKISSTANFCGICGANQA